MKKVLSLLLTAFFVSLPSVHAELTGKDFFNKDTKIIGMNVLLDVDATADDSIGIGYEGIFATPWNDLDEVGLLVGHRDNTDVDMTHVMFFISDQYDLTRPVNDYYETPGYVFAYGLLGVGHGWANLDDAGDFSSMLFRVEGGIKLFFVKNIALVGGIRHDWSDEEVFLDDDGKVEDKNWEFVTGVRFHY